MKRQAFESEQCLFCLNWGISRDEISEESKTCKDRFCFFCHEYICIVSPCEFTTRKRWKKYIIIFYSTLLKFLATRRPLSTLSFIVLIYLHYLCQKEITISVTPSRINFRKHPYAKWDLKCSSARGITIPLATFKRISVTKDSVAFRKTEGKIWYISSRELIKSFCFHKEITFSPGKLSFCNQQSKIFWADLSFID